MTLLSRSMLEQFELALGSSASEIDLSAGSSYPSVFAVSDLAQASIACAAGALGALISEHSGTSCRISVDRDLSSAWFLASIRPQGWTLLSPWDAIAGDYATADGWIKLHTNAPHHRARAIEVLGVREDRGAVAAAVLEWRGEELETAIVDAGGAAAAMKSLGAWKVHPQARAVARDPLLFFDDADASLLPIDQFGDVQRPLAGIKIVDLTRVLAGPVATRLLAGWGAQVLRIDPPDWDEPGIVPEVTLGKRCARLDLRSKIGLEQCVLLLSEADILVSGYRSDALDRLGLGAEQRQAIRPGLVDVSLDAYGWSGPWARRRGFDSLVQMSAGIAHTGMVAAGSPVPVPLPVQALDHATGYLLAAAAISGLTHRLKTGRGSRWRTSLASMARVLVDAGVDDQGLANDGSSITNVSPVRLVEKTAWGDALRLPPPVDVTGAPLRWSLASRPLGSDPAAWRYP